MCSINPFQPNGISGHTLLLYLGNSNFDVASISVFKRTKPESMQPISSDVNCTWLKLAHREVWPQ